MSSKNPLNKEQRSAVETDKASMLIVAGAGTGKTRVLVEKIVHLLDNGVPAETILALTFTNKAGDEMRGRIRRKAGGTEGLFIGTFHSYCANLLREFGPVIGIQKNFSVVDAGTARRIIKRCMKDLEIDEVKPARLQKLISGIKTENLLETTKKKGGQDVFRRMAETVTPAYVAALRKENLLDFDDLLLETVRLLENSASVRKEIQNRYTHILVDEFQDTDDVQNKLLSLIKGKGAWLIVVGDTDQTIYSWRGASVHNLLNFTSQHQNARTHLLTKNYRSTKNILEGANAVIQKNILRQEKDLQATRGEGEDIKIVCGHDEDDEASQIAEEILRLRHDGAAYAEIAVLFRTNFQSRALEMQMLRHAIPYTVLGARFFDRREIKDLLAYLTLTINRRSREAYERAAKVPRRGIGAVSLEKIFSGEAESLPSRQREQVAILERDIDAIAQFAGSHTIAETLVYLVKRLHYAEHLEKTYDNAEERMEQVKELIVFAKKFSMVAGNDAMAAFLSEISLGTDQDTLRVQGRKNAVRLMTIHSAKGLEFPHVFISGMEEGLLPLIKEEQGREDAEEERRLCYVAMTRAKDSLYCSFALRRGMFGTHKTARPSSFLYDIPEELIDGRRYLRRVQFNQGSHDTDDETSENHIHW